LLFYSFPDEATEVLAQVSSIDIYGFEEQKKTAREKTEFWREKVHRNLGCEKAKK
jgi:hypothetical protein